MKRSDLYRVREELESVLISLHCATYDNGAPQAEAASDLAAAKDQLKAIIARLPGAQANAPRLAHRLETLNGRPGTLAGVNPGRPLSTQVEGKV